MRRPTKASDAEREVEEQCGRNSDTSWRPLTAKRRPMEAAKGTV